MEKKVKAIASKEDRSMGVIMDVVIGDDSKVSMVLKFNINIINMAMPLRIFNLNMGNLAIDNDVLK